MLKREGLRFLCRRVATLDCRANLISWGMMALNKDLFSTGVCRFSHMSSMNGLCGSQRKVVFDVVGGFRLELFGGLRLKGCLGDCDGDYGTDANKKSIRKIDDRLQKAAALARHRQLLHDSDVGLDDLMSIKSKSGRVGYEGGSLLGFPEQTVPKKLVVAVDVDEVLGSFLSALNKFVADRYALNHSVSEFYVYEFCKIWNCSRNEADLRVHEFFKTAYFKSGIHPIPGSQHALHRLSSFCNLSVVTSRQNAIKDHTIEWIEKYYPGLFQEIHFGNHFALEGKSRPKSEICRSFGAQFLIDDNPRYAIECAEAGIKVLLFDYDNSYPWCKCDSALVHPLVSKVHSWVEVVQHLTSRAIS